MADNSKELDDEIERLRNASVHIREVMDKMLKNQDKLFSSEEQAKKAAIASGQAWEKSMVKFKKSTEDLTKDIEKLSDGVKDGTKTAQDLEKELESLRAQVNNTADSTKKAQLLQAKSELERENARNKASTIFKESMGQLGGTVLAGFANSFKSATKAALSGGDGLQVAADFMSSNIDNANKATQVGASALTTFGQATMGAGGRVGAMGMAATAAGTAISYLSNNVSELAKAGIQFMLTQTQKMIAGFQQMSSVGALYSDGLKGMVQASVAAGMTLEQFSKVVVANRDELSKLGMGLGAGSKRLSASIAEGGESARQGMYALGMNMEEQADAYAKTMALMAGPSGQLKASNAEVAAQTRDYARNLKLISEITGQDAKARMEKVRQDNDTLSFNSYLNGLSETERKKTVEAMALMSEADQRAFREKQIYGEVISADLAVSRATNSGIRKAQDEQYAAAQQHNLSTKVVADSYERNNKEAMEESNKLGQTMGRAREGIGAEASKTVNAQSQFMAKFKDATKNAELISKAEKTIDDEGKPKVEVGLQEAQQKFSVKMQDVANKNLERFADALDTTIKQIEDAVAGLANLSAGAGSTSPIMTALTGIMGGLVPIALQVAIGKIAGGGGPGMLGGLKGMLGGGAPTGPAAGSLAGWKTGATAAAQAAEGGGMLSKAAGIGGKMLSKASIGGILGGFALDYTSDKLKESGHEKLGGAASIGSAALSGAGTGAMIGSVIPVLGTAVGGAVGGAIGTGYGLYKNWGSMFGGGDKTPGAAPSMQAVSQTVSEHQRMLDTRKAAGAAGSDTAKTITVENDPNYAQLGKMVDLLKKHNDLLEQSMGKYDQIAKIMEENKNITQQLSYNMS